MPTPRPARATARRLLGLILVGFGIVGLLAGLVQVLLPGSEAYATLTHSTPAPMPGPPNAAPPDPAGPVAPPLSFVDVVRPVFPLIGPALGFALGTALALPSRGLGLIGAMILLVSGPWAAPWDAARGPAGYAMFYGGLLAVGVLLRRRPVSAGPQPREPRRSGGARPDVRPTTPAVAEIGIPGEDLYGAVGRTMEREQVRMGALGENLTARIVRSVAAEFPGLTIVHGIKVPGADRWDIDHAVVYGGLVVFIDSKAYRPGSYAWADGSIEPIPLPPQRRRRNHLVDAVARVRPLLPPGTVCDLCIVMHPNRATGTIEIVGDPHPTGLPALRTAADFRSTLLGSLSRCATGGQGSLPGSSVVQHAQIVDALRRLVPEYVARRSYRPGEVEPA